MSIVKNTPHYLKHSKKAFTTLQNSTIEAIKDPASLGVYVYLASKPDNWEISETNLQNRFCKGRDFIRARIADLKKIGLMESVCFRNEQGIITYWETVLYNEAHNTTKASPDKASIQNPENPGTGKTRHLVNPPTTNKRIKKIKDINNLSHSVECDLFLEVEQQRKSLMLRDKTVRHEKCKELYEQLPPEVKCDKSFEDIHDECVTHYATQTDPQMVSPQRLISWIKREIKFHANQPNQTATYQKPGDSFNQYMNSQKKGETYDQHGNTYKSMR